MAFNDLKHNNNTDELFFFFAKSYHHVRELGAETRLRTGRWCPNQKSEIRWKGLEELETYRSEDEDDAALNSNPTSANICTSFKLRKTCFVVALKSNSETMKLNERNNDFRTKAMETLRILGIHFKSFFAKDVNLWMRIENKGMHLRHLLTHVEAARQIMSEEKERVSERQLQPSVTIWGCVYQGRAPIGPTW